MNQRQLEAYQDQLVQEQLLSEEMDRLVEEAEDENRQTKTKA